MGDLTGPGAFATDDGSVPAAVAEVLGRRAAGAASIREVVTSLAGHRLLIPLLEVDGTQLVGDDTDPCAGSDRAMAAVSVREADGRPLGLAFTGMAPMLRWDGVARPLPVAATRAAAAVLAEGGRALVVDAGSPHSCRIEGAALTRLASGEAWPVPWEDPAVRAAVVSEFGPVLASGELQLRLVAPAPDGPLEVEDLQDSRPIQQAGRSPGLLLELRFPTGVPVDMAEQRAAVVASRMSRSGPLREVFDGVLAVQVVADRVDQPARPA